MRILLDQNIHAPVLTWRQERIGSHAEVRSSRTLGIPRMTDDELFELCQREQMVIVTYDEDFQNTLVIPRNPGCGVVRLNVFSTGILQTQRALERLLEAYPVEKWERASIVIDPHKIRYQRK